MSDITLITPPDHIFGDCYSYLLIYPNKDIKEQFNTIIANIESPLHVYLYDDPEAQDAEWLLTAVSKVSTIILDVDNCPAELRSILGFIIAKPKTYWLTNGEDMYYNKLSNKRVYNLDFITTGGNFEETK
jgi:hypothetical protein